MYEIINLIKTIQDLRYLNDEKKEEFTHQVLHATCKSIAGMETTHDITDLKQALKEVTVDKEEEEVTAEDVTAEDVTIEEVTIEEVTACFNTVKGRDELYAEIEKKQSIARCSDEKHDGDRFLPVRKFYLHREGLQRACITCQRNRRADRKHRRDSEEEVTTNSEEEVKD